MHAFLTGLLGGALIGVSAAILLLFSGHILGASGIVSSVGLDPFSSLQNPDQHWKIVLLAAFLLTSNLFLASDYHDKQSGLARLSWAAYLIGGFFVGFGTKLGNGCTSGHGICGLPRLSKRSLVAVMTFMAVGIITAYLTQASTSPLPREILSFLRDDSTHTIAIWDKPAALITFFVALAALVSPSFMKFSSEKVQSVARRKLAPSAVAGALFAGGLYLSQMVYPVRVFGFLNMGLLAQGEWDATLVFVMGGGVFVMFLAYQFVEGQNLLPNYGVVGRLSKPLCLNEGGATFCVPSSQLIDWHLILGASSFGLGWGISGLCPGPAMVLAGIGVSWVLVCYWPAFFLGAHLAALVKGRQVSEQPRQLANDPPLSNEVKDKHQHYGTTGVLPVADDSHV